MVHVRVFLEDHMSWLTKEFEKALIVLDSEKDSLTILGDYRRILHCNAASTEGARRLIMTSYCSHALVKLFAASH